MLCLSAGSSRAILHPGLKIVKKAKLLPARAKKLPAGAKMPLLQPRFQYFLPDTLENDLTPFILHKFMHYTQLQNLFYATLILSFAHLLYGRNATYLTLTNCVREGIFRDNLFLKCTLVQDIQYQTLKCPIHDLWRLEKIIIRRWEANLPPGEALLHPREANLQTCFESRQIGNFL